MTTQQKEWTCDTAQAAYQAYQAVIEAGHKPSNQEIYAAAAGATFLRIWCGWDSPATRAAVAGAESVPMMDHNWVPVIVPPAR